MYKPSFVIEVFLLSWLCLSSGFSVAEAVSVIECTVVAVFLLPRLSRF